MQRKTNGMQRQRDGMEGKTDARFWTAPPAIQMAKPREQECATCIVLDPHDRGIWMPHGINLIIMSFPWSGRAGSEPDLRPRFTAGSRTHRHLNRLLSPFQRNISYA